MNFHDTIIVGAGASGLIASIISKDLGCDVAILEGTSRIGNKILTTGNGRCNISNSKISSPFNTYQSSNKNFYCSTLSNFSVEDTKNFFFSLGLPIIELENQKLFPKSLQASSVVDILKISIEEKGIPVYFNNKVKHITKKKNKFTLQTDSENFCCNKLILACGGKSAVKTGSDGSGYKLAKELGHNIIPTVPGIVQLKLNYPYLKALSGIKINGKASIIINKKIVKEDSGEILFTDYGISGPPILQLSAIASRALYNKQDVKIKIDIMPDLTQNEVDDFILGHLAMFPNRSILDCLIGVINKKLIPTLLKDIGIYNIHMPSDELPWSQKNALCQRLKSWIFDCTDTNGFNNAQLTVGGIDTSEVNPKSLQSNLINNLYFCGEILDVNGDCGGFNLQWAWSSGYIVGNSVAKL